MDMGEDIKNYCKGKISHQKIPRYIKFVDEFPMTVTGKIQNFRMKEIYTEELKLKDKPVALISLGYSAENPVPKQRNELTEILKYNQESYINDISLEIYKYLSKYNKEKKLKKYIEELEQKTSEKEDKSIIEFDDKYEKKQICKEILKIIFDDLYKSE